MSDVEKARAITDGSRADRRREASTPVKARFKTDFRGKKVEVHMDAAVEENTVELVVQFLDETGKSIRFKNVTREELAELCRIAAENPA